MAQLFLRTSREGAERVMTDGFADGPVDHIVDGKRLRGVWLSSDGYVEPWDRRHGHVAVSVELDVDMVELSGFEQSIPGSGVRQFALPASYLNECGRAYLADAEWATFSSLE